MTKDAITLPALPEPAVISEKTDEPYAYTAEQMLAFQRDTVEACAKAAMTLYDGYMDGEADRVHAKAVLGCASAIRSMK